MVKKKGVGFEINEKGCFCCNSHVPYQNGYAYMTHRAIRKRIHRHIFEEMFGPIPEGLVIRHKCDNRLCVNPEHMELGTPADNVRDRDERGRTACGERNGSSRLTEAEVLEIINIFKKKGKKKTIEDVARLYFVSGTTIRKIKEGKAWKHLSN